MHETHPEFINNLKTSGKLMDYNQIAFLFNLVKHPRVSVLARFLEENLYQCLLTAFGYVFPA